MRKFCVFLGVLLLAFTMAFSQTRPITGKVVDKNGQPVSGASVVIKGSTTGTATDDAGNFKLTVKSGQVLVISAMSFGTLEVKTGTKAAFMINLDKEDAQLSEVVVTALGIKREKRSLGTATQTIGADQLNKSGTGNALQELNGKTSGLTVINSAGDPGAGTYIRLRGVTSITGNNQPLMVVDGIPIDNSVNSYDPTNAGFLASGANGDLTGGAQPTNRGTDINPEDIESISVLKGPAATALYGIQAASGAIVITTKKGGGKHGTSVVFSSSMTIDKVSQLPPLQNQYSQGTGGQYRGPSLGGSTSWGAAIDTLFWNGDPTYAYDKHGDIVGKSSPLAKTPVTPYDRYKFFQTGFSYNNNISLSGSSPTEKSTYRLSLGNLSQTGIIPKSKYVKTTFSLNGQSQITDRLTASAGITYTNSSNNKVQQGSNLSGVMLGLVRTPATFDNSNGYSNAANQDSAYIMPDGTQRNYRGGAGYDNPYWTVNKAPFTSDLNRIFGYGQANYKLYDWMDLSYRVGGDIYAQNDKNSYDIGTNAASAGAIYLIDYYSRQFNSDVIINMHKQLSSDWFGSLMLGQNFFSFNQGDRFSSGTTLQIPGFFDMSNAASYLASEAESRKKTMAFYGQAELNYKKELYLTVTGRRETSSTLPAANNTFFYPSVSLGWVFTEMKSLKNNSVLSFGKIRASFAQVGKDAPIHGLNTPFSSATFHDGFTTGITFPANGSAGYQVSSGITTVGNPNLKPENTYSYELGTDLSFFHDRISLNATAYYSKSTDVIFPVSVPYSTGFAAVLLNAATLTNKGLELTLSTSPIKTRDIRWDVNFNWSRNLNKVTQLYNGINRFFVAGFGGGEAEIDAVVGQPFGVIYGSTTPHVDLNNLKSPLLISDVTGAGYAQPIGGGVGNNQVIGNPNPDWIGSAISNLSYKAFTFSFQIDIKHGGDLWNGTRGALANKGTAGETANRGASTLFQGMMGHLDANNNVVHFAADGVTEIAGPGAVNTTKSTYDQYYWQNVGNSFGGGQETDIENAGFTRLRQVSITYQLPKTVFGRSHFTNLSFTLFANNLKLWTKYDGVDPETSLAGPVNAQGLDYFNNPGTKSYGIRLNLGL